MEGYEILWKGALNELANSVSSITYSTYITMLTPVDIEDGKLVLVTPNEFFAKEIAGRLAETIRESLKKTNSEIYDFELCVGTSREDYLKQAATLQKQDVNGMPLNPKFTFESFVVGGSNEFIYAAAKAVAENPGEAYNPLFIYGGTGLGKTHILMAIANYLKVHAPSKKVMYTTCERFTNQLIESISRGKNNAPEFRNRYRNVDVLLIDDVQFLAHKSSTQIEFFHTFNELIGQNKQIVLTSDRPPKEIDELEERLRTRFEGGLIGDVQPPDIETRIAILKKKAEERKCVVDIKVLSFLAETSTDDIRTLIGKLTKVIFASKLHEKPITVELAEDALKESATSPQEEIKVDDIINSVCSFYKITKGDLIGKKKTKEVVEPRQICIYLITELMSLPLVTIGQKMGGRDHTTVIYARNKISELIASNDKIAVDVNDIKNMILKQ